MRLRMFLVAGSALAAAAALSLVPAAQADPPSGPIGPIASVKVGSSTATADYGATLDLQPGPGGISNGPSITMGVYGVQTEMHCWGGDGTGTVHAGNPAPSPFMNLSSLSVGCMGWGGNSNPLSFPTNGCAKITMNDATVREGTVDTGSVDKVTGYLNLPPGCHVSVNVHSFCSYTIGGTAVVEFDEAATSTSPVKQDLTLKGNGLTIQSVRNCMGAVSVGSLVTLKNFVFSTTVNGFGAVDFRPQPSNIASVGVGGSIATADHGAALTLKPGASMNMKVFGSPTELDCSSGSATGTVHAGSPPPGTFMNLDSMTPVCDSIIPGATSSWSVPANGCANIAMSDSNVHDGTVDTPGSSGFDNVQGYFHLPTGCEITVAFASNPCTYTIGGSTGVEFDEALTSTSPVKQDLILKGSGLKVRSVGFACFGALTVGDPVTFNNFKLSTTLNGGAGAIDFRQSNIGAVRVGGSTATADHGAALTLKPGASTNMKVYGSPTELDCASGSGTGTVHEGSPAPATFMNLDSMTAVCESPMPGQTNSWSVPNNGCANITLTDNDVHNGTSDSVAGSLNLPTGCEITVTTAGHPCTYTIGGSTGVEFDEALTSTSPVKQDLILTGSGLKVRSVGFLCFGALTVGDPVTFNNFKFSTTVNGGAGAIDVRKTA